MKRTMNVVFVAILMVLLAGCGDNRATAISEPTTSVSVSRSVETKKPETTVSTLEPEPAKVEIDFQKQSYTFKDQDGYEFEITVKISPWILQSNSELVNAAWSEVGQNNVLPTIDSLGLRDMPGDSTRYQKKFGDYEVFSCRKSNFDMYFAMGTIEIKNVTSGFGISKENKKSISLYFDSASFVNYDYLDVPVISRTYFSTPRDCAPNVDIRSVNLGIASMSNDSWGPVTFVLMHGESSSPNNPDGIYRKDLEAPLRFSHYQLMFNTLSKMEVAGVPEEYVLTFPMSVQDPE